jgi:hypothetical protein
VIRAGAAAVLLAALAVSFTSVGGQAASKPGSAASLCRADEAVVYSCRFGRKLGSVCAGNGQAHYRFGKPGEPEVEIASAPDWSNVRIGMVTGQQGGSQHHIRFTQGDSHYIVFHGVDGQLADRPGRTYSGVVQVLGPEGEWEGNSWDCKRRAAIHPDFEDTVAALAPEALRGSLIETEGSAFDGWF